MNLGTYHKILGKFPPEFAIDRLDKYKYTEMPQPPSEIIKYAKSKVQDKNFEMKEGYWRQKELFLYLEKLSQWSATNKSNYTFLKFLELYFKNDNIVYKIKTKLEEFTELDINGKHTWNLQGIDFVRYLAGFSEIPF